MGTAGQFIPIYAHGPRLAVRRRWGAYFEATNDEALPGTRVGSFHFYSIAADLSKPIGLSAVNWIPHDDDTFMPNDLEGQPGIVSTWLRERYDVHMACGPRRLLVGAFVHTVNLA